MTELVSPLQMQVTIEGDTKPLWQHEGRELVRAFSSALFVALPLLYTLEMWERARNVPQWDLALILLLAYAVNVGYCSFSNYKSGCPRVNIWWDPVIAMGLGFLASVITLFITARITLDTSINVSLSLYALMIVPTSIGASIAINQLGSRNSGEDKCVADSLPRDAHKLIATVLGGILFGFNVAPTIEPKVMLAETGWWHALAIMIFSLMISYLIEYTAKFNSGEGDGGSGNILSDKWLSTLVTYLIALVTSALLLWMFGYINLSVPPQMWVIWVIILGYATTIGGAAGRLIL